MTMIAYALQGQRAIVMTDSLAYTPNCSRFAHSTKILTLPHLDTAIVTRGDIRFGNLAKIAVMDAATHEPTFDALVESVPQILRGLWRGAHDQRQPIAYGDLFTLFLIGYSPDAGRFVAFSFGAHDHFAPTVPTATRNEPFLLPAPWTRRPSRLELDETRRDFAALDFDDEQRANADNLLAEWETQPPVEMPWSAEDWQRLAIWGRSRATSPIMKIPVGGFAQLSILDRGGNLETMRLMEFDDIDNPDGEIFRKMIEATDHPQALLGACWCDSGRRLADCHALERRGEPCGCESGLTFGECCLAAAIGDDRTASAMPARTESVPA